MKNLFHYVYNQFRNKKWGWLALFFTIVTVIFTFPLLREIVKNSEFGSFGEDTILVHYFAETAYRHLLNGTNPFQYNASILYPFGSATVLGETGVIHAFYFLFLRPFLTPYASLLAVVCINLLLCQIAMYSLLRYLKVNHFISAVFAVVYAFSPFVSVRIQYHFNYVYHFLFPLITVLILQVLYQKDRNKRIVFALALGISSALLFYNTLYYVFMYLLFALFFSSFYIFINRRQLISVFFVLGNSFRYFLIAGIMFLILLAPFLIQLAPVLQTADLKKTPGWGGAIEFSANALDIVTPSEFNPFTGKIAQKLSPERQPVEQIIYPGILVLAGIMIYLFGKRGKLQPLLWTGFSFYILSLGPFLHIYRFWNIRITETILGVIPLPYIILHRLPFLSMMRSPVRFGVMIAFAGAIIAALVFDKYFKDRPDRKSVLYPLLILIFFVDQFFITNIQPREMQLPLKSYQIIKQDTSKTTVMEIPYVIQDGFFYWGKVFHAYPMIGQLYHGKQIIGGYVARVSESKFNYYSQDPFLGYYGYIGDEDRQKNKFIFQKPSLSSMRESIDFLEIKYVLVQESLPAYKTIESDFMALGYKKTVQKDNGFSLFVREPVIKESTKVDLNRSQSLLFYGFSKAEPALRWIDGSNAGFLVKKINTKPLRINAKTVAYKIPRKVAILVNGVVVKEIIVNIEPSDISFTTPDLAPGINKIEFAVRTSSPEKLQGEDPRDLTVAISDLVIE